MFASLGALQRSIDEWIVAVSHYFPGITPSTVWDVPVYLWQAYVDQTQALIEEAGKQ